MKRCLHTIFQGACNGLISRFHLVCSYYSSNGKAWVPIVVVVLGFWAPLFLSLSFTSVAVFAGPRSCFSVCLAAAIEVICRVCICLSCCNVSSSFFSSAPKFFYFYQCSQSALRHLSTVQSLCLARVLAPLHGHSVYCQVSSQHIHLYMFPTLWAGLLLINSSCIWSFFIVWQSETCVPSEQGILHCVQVCSCQFFLNRFRPSVILANSPYLPLDSFFTVYWMLKRPCGIFQKENQNNSKIKKYAEKFQTIIRWHLVQRSVKNN